MKKEFHTLSRLLLLLAVLTVLSAFRPQAMAATNLLKNGTASAGLKNWKDSTGTWMTSTDMVDPIKGAYFAPGQTEETELTQDVSVKKYAEGTMFELTASCRDWNGSDTCLLTLSYLNKSGKVLTSLTRAYQEKEWKTIRVLAKMPAGAVTARVSLGARRNNGSDNDAYFDNVKLLKSSKKDSNLLYNGSGEYGMSCWTDPDDAWSSVTAQKNTLHAPIDGEYFLWPARKELSSSKIYQDVRIDSSQIGKTLVLSAWLANYDQSPHDQASLTLTFLNKKGKKISAVTQSQRNPAWKKHYITAVIPKNTAKVRVTLSGKRFVGQDLDCYFDDVRLELVNKTYSKISVTSKEKGTCRVGDKRTLTAAYGTVKKASAFSWSTSYDLIAKVSKKGVVTFLSEGTVTIYATHKTTHVTGAITFHVKS